MVSTRVPGARRRIGRRSVIASVAIVALGSSAGFGVHWLYSPHLIAAGGATVGAPGVVGHPMYFGDMVFTDASPGDRAVDLRAVRARIKTNTTQAEVRVLVCVIGPDGGVGNGAASTDRCRQVTPFTPGVRDIGYTAGKIDIVLAITPLRSGTTEIDGVDIHYRDGIRRGHAKSGVIIEVHTSG